MRDIEYFLAIHRYGSINKAAASLFMSQPALSQYILRMEKRIGVKLFNRTANNSLELTESGNCYLEYCLKSEHLYKSCMADLHTIKNREINHLVIGCSATYLQTLLADSEIAELLNTSGIEILIDNAVALYEMLLSNKIDLILGPIGSKQHNCSYYVAQRNELDLYVSRNHPLAKYSYLSSANAKLRMPISIASPYPFVLLDRKSVLRSINEEYFHITGFHPIASYDAKRSVDVIMQLITSNAVGFISQMDNKFDSIVPIALDPPMIYRRGAIYRKDEQLPQVLKELIRKCSDINQNGDLLNK